MVVVVACWPLDLLGASGPTLNQMLVVKAAYCGLLGFALARRTILRQLPDEKTGCQVRIARPAVNNAIYECHAGPACRAIAKNS